MENRVKKRIARESGAYLDCMVSAGGSQGFRGDPVEAVTNGEGKRQRRILKRGFRACLLAALMLAVFLSGCADKETEPSQDGTVGTAQNGDVGGEDAQGGPAGTGEEDLPGNIVFEGQDMEGNAVTSDIFAQSKLTMINVWATYCNPCLSEMPELAQLPDEYAAGDFQLIGIISDVTEGADQATMELAEGLIEQTGADYPHMLMNLSVYNALMTDVRAVPTTFFLDGEGRLLDTVIGAMDKESWKEKIDGLLEGL